MAVADAFRRHWALRRLLDRARAVRDLARRWAGPGSAFRASAARVDLWLRALPAFVTRGRRRAELDAAIAALPEPAIETRLVSIVGLGPRESPSPEALGVTIETVATADEAHGELVGFVTSWCEPLDRSWLARLAAAVTGDVTAATPCVVRPAAPFTAATPHDLRVASCGYDVALVDDAPALRARGSGSRVTPGDTPDAVAIGSPACLVVSRAALRAAGGFDARGVPGRDAGVALVDLCLRLRAGGGRIMAVPAALVADHRPVRSRAALRDPFAADAGEGRDLIARLGPSLYRTVRDPALPRIAITTGAPSTKVASRWGDWHFGNDLARALRRSGYEVRVQTAPEADAPASRSCDIHLVLHGLVSVRATPGQRQILWVISHPETVGNDDLAAADVVFVASTRFAGALRDRTDTPVEALLQATDHHRFRPEAADPIAAHPVVVVAKTRTVMRPIVADALAAGLRPAIYGSGWEEFVDPSLVVAQYVANDTLPRVYASAGVVLNDHWAEMRDLGFVSNRIFDVLACGTPVISDDLPEIAAIFGDAVPTADGPDELRTLVEAILADPDAARERARRGRDMVLAAHTFDQRAHALLDAISRYQLFIPPSSEPRSG